MGKIERVRFAFSGPDNASGLPIDEPAIAARSEDCWNMIYEGDTITPGMTQTIKALGVTAPAARILRSLAWDISSIAHTIQWKGFDNTRPLCINSEDWYQGLSCLVCGSLASMVEATKTLLKSSKVCLYGMPSVSFQLMAKGRETERQALLDAMSPILSEQEGIWAPSAYPEYVIRSNRDPKRPEEVISEGELRSMLVPHLMDVRKRAERRGAECSVWISPFKQGKTGYVESIWDNETLERQVKLVKEAGVSDVTIWAHPVGGDEIGRAINGTVMFRDMLLA